MIKTVGDLIEELQKYDRNELIAGFDFEADLHLLVVNKQDLAGYYSKRLIRLFGDEVEELKSILTVSGF